jgi:hypothetical protein
MFPGTEKYVFIRRELAGMTIDVNASPTLSFGSYSRTTTELTFDLYFVMPVKVGVLSGQQIGSDSPAVFSTHSAVSLKTHRQNVNRMQNIFRKRFFV